MGTKIKLHLSKDYDRSLVPIPATKYKDWWEDNQSGL